MSQFTLDCRRGESNKAGVVGYWHLADIRVTEGARCLLLTQSGHQGGIDSRNISTPRVLVFTSEPRAGNLLKFFKRTMHGRRDPLVLRGRLK
jgi:hypothetical protein